MANFCIMRIEKRKDMGSVRRCAAHHLRTVETPNADPNGRIRILAGSPESDDVTAIIGASTKPLMKRKDAIRCLDVFCGASPEFFAQGGSVREFEALTMEWARETFGADNIVLAVTHEDESTPHVQLLVTPITPKGNLSASHWIDGPKKLRAMQDSFADTMKPLGLVRGIEGSKAKHQDIKTWYGKLEPAMRKAEKLLAEADQVEVKQISAAAKNAAEASRLAEAKTALIEWQTELKNTSNEMKREQKNLADREAIVVRQESILQRLAADLQRQKEALQEAFKTLPMTIQAKLAAIFKQPKKEPVTPAKPAEKPSPATEDLSPKLAAKKSIFRPS